MISYQVDGSISWIFGDEIKNWKLELGDIRKGLPNFHISEFLFCSQRWNFSSTLKALSCFSNHCFFRYWVGFHFHSWIFRWELGKDQSKRTVCKRRGWNLTRERVDGGWGDWGGHRCVHPAHSQICPNSWAGEIIETAMLCAMAILYRTGYILERETFYLR